MRAASPVSKGLVRQGLDVLGVSRMNTLEFQNGTLLLTGMPSERVRKAFPGGAFAWDSRAGVWRSDAVHYRAVAEKLQQIHALWEDRVPRWGRVRWPARDLLALRSEQQEAVASWREHGCGCVVMPTGTGKTEVALAAISEVGLSTLVVAPVRDLMYQWHRRILERLGYDAGVIGDNVFRVRRVSVTTYDSACIHMERFGNRFGMVVFDECHHLPGPVRRDAALMSAAPYRLGLTATMERSDGAEMDLEALIGPTVYHLPISEAKGRSLAEYEVVRIPIELSPREQLRYEELSRVVRHYMAERRKEDPEFSWEDLCADSGKTPEARRAMRAYREKKSIEERAEEKFRVLEDLFSLHMGEPCLVFVGSNQMARDISRRFLIPCLLSHSDKKERLDVLRGLEHGVYPALVANRVLDEGVDLPEVKVAVVLGGSSSTRQAKQRLGRILRKAGNARAVLYEVVSGGTKEEKRSSRRRRSDAFAKVRHRRL